MRLFLKTSGGFGNLQIQGALDTDELPEMLAERVRTVLTPDRLSVSRASDAGSGADLMQYELDLFLGSSPQKFRFDDMTASPQVLDTVQELIQEIIKRKQQSS